MDAAEQGENESALRADLEVWGAVVPVSLAAAALNAARRLDSGSVSATGAALLHGQYRQYLAQLLALAPVRDAADDVNDLQRQRDKRRREAGMA